MATHHKDFEHMRSAIDYAGPTLVDHGFHLADPGPQHPVNDAARADYKATFYPEEGRPGAGPVRAVKDVHVEGYTPKVFYRARGNVWMLKPYHECALNRDLEPSLEEQQQSVHYPLFGWAEQATQALFHAGGIGHLIQHSQATMHPISATEHHPMLAVQFHPYINKPSYIPNERLKTRPIGLYDDSMKVGMMDFLTNNRDRHEHNLLWGHKPGTPESLELLAIDNARSFQYKSGHWSGSQFDRKDHLAPYLMHGGIEGLSGNGMHPWDDQHIQHATNWWQENSPFIRDALVQHLEAIKDKSVRKHIHDSFNDRADALDRFAVAFSAAPKFELYSPYADKPNARGVLDVKIRKHKPIYPWG